MKNYVLILLVYTLSACSTSKFLKNTQLSEDTESEYYYDVDRTILNKFSKISDKTNHIIYLYVTSDEVYSEAYTAMIYDLDNDQYYEITNPSGQTKDFNISKVNGFDSSNYCQFIISTYLKDPNYLKWLYENEMSEEVFFNYLYDIDLKKETTLKLEFTNLAFIDGMPFLETPYAKSFFDMKIVEPYLPR